MYSCLPVSHPVRSAVPTFEPITIDEAKQQLHLRGNSAHDEWLIEHISSARRTVEHDALRVCATGAHTVKRTGFGYADFFEMPSSTLPVASITSIYYVNTSGTNTLWSSSEYTLDTYPKIPQVRLNHGYSWPTLRGDYNGITITFVAGYASQALVPEDLKTAVKMKLTELWHLSMEMYKEAESDRKAYDNLIPPLRPEVYA